MITSFFDVKHCVICDMASCTYTQLSPKQHMYEMSISQFGAILWLKHSFYQRMLNFPIHDLGREVGLFPEDF